MPTAARVRVATGADLPEVASLSRQANRGMPENDEATIARHLSAYLSAGGSVFVLSDVEATQYSEVHQRDTNQVSLATSNGGPLVGYALCRRIEPLFYAVDRSLILDVIFVAPAARRRGYGHDLLLAVAEFARQIGAGYVYTTPAAADRPLHRFFASLGFAPIAGNRVVSTSVLLRKLLREDPITQGIAIRSKTRTPTRTPIDEVIAKRKRALRPVPTNLGG